MKFLWITILLVSCKSRATESEGRPAPTPIEKPTPDPACAAKAAELAPFLAQLYLESASAEINMGWTPQIVDRTAAPVEQFTADAVTLTPEVKAAFDASETNHVDNNLGVSLERLQKTFETKTEKRANHAKLRIDVDVAVTWGDVVGVVDAARTAGYTDVVFAFETVSKLSPPPGVPSRTEDLGSFDKAEARRSELVKLCDPLASVGLNAMNDSPIQMAKARGTLTAEALVTCNCKPTPDELKAAIWQTERWTQAHLRTPISIKLAGDSAIEQPSAMPWSEAHRALLDADGKSVRLVATK